MNSFEEPLHGNGDTFIEEEENFPINFQHPLGTKYDSQGSSSKPAREFDSRKGANTWMSAPLEGDLDWDAWDTPREPTPGPGQSSSQCIGSSNEEDFLAAFKRATIHQQQRHDRSHSPPIIDLRNVGKEQHPNSEKTVQNTLQPSDLDFFEAFEKSPRDLMANSRADSNERAQLRGGSLKDMEEAQNSPMGMQELSKGNKESQADYFEILDPVKGRISSSPINMPGSTQESSSSSSPYDDKQSRHGSWSETAGAWAGSFRRTLGSIRGHLPSTKDFYVPDEESHHDDAADGKAPILDTSLSKGATRSSDTSFSDPLHHDPHSRKIAHLNDYSQGTPFGAHDGFSPPQASPVQRRADHTMYMGPHHAPTAPISGAPGFNPGTERNWNTGSWSLSAREENERAKNPIPVELHGRREETQEVVQSSVAAVLTAYLPRRLQLGKSWKLLYSSDQHGISIGTLYHKVATGLEISRAQGRKASTGGIADAEGWLRGASENTRAAVTGIQRVGGGLNIREAGLVLAIRDSEDHLFGAFVNERIRAQSSYYGSGEW